MWQGKWQSKWQSKWQNKASLFTLVVRVGNKQITASSILDSFRKRPVIKPEMYAPPFPVNTSIIAAKACTRGEPEMAKESGSDRI